MTRQTTIIPAVFGIRWVFGIALWGAQFLTNSLQTFRRWWPGLSKSCIHAFAAKECLVYEWEIYQSIKKAVLGRIGHIPPVYKAALSCLL